MTFCCTTVDKANNLMTKVERIVSSSMLIMLIKTKFGNTPSPRCHLVRWYCKRWLWVGKATLPWAEALVQWLRVRIQAPHGWIAFHIFVVVKNGLMFQKTENKLKEAKDGPFKKTLPTYGSPLLLGSQSTKHDGYWGQRLNLLNRITVSLKNIEHGFTCVKKGAGFKPQPIVFREPDDHKQFVSSFSIGY